MKKLVFAIICLLPAFTCQARTIIVDANGSGEYPTIQDAIDDSNNGDIVILTPGTYTGQGNRDIDFNGLAITVRSTDPNDPNIVAVTIIDCNGTKADRHRGFYLHSGETFSSVIAGFTITSGYANDGGAICCENSNCTIANCNIIANKASRGGGIYTGGQHWSGVTVTNCTISGNSATNRGAGICHLGSRYAGPTTISNCIITNNVAGRDDEGGGGIEYAGGPSSELRVNNCIIRGNSAGWYGGGILHWGRNATITNCIINDNSARDAGGGICGAYASAKITNCVISGNLAESLGNEAGGGVYGIYGGSITNCTIVGNFVSGGTVHGYEKGGGLNQCFCPVTNCIITANRVRGESGQIGVCPTPTYSCIQDWTDALGGVGNTGQDPCFVDPGYWDVNDVWTEGNYHLLPASPCINAGDPDYILQPNETDLDGNPRVIAGRIDMGAYESNHIEARLWILPRTINRHSRQRRIMAWLRLPQGVTRDDIDSNTPLLLYPGEIEPTRQYIFQRGRRPKRVSIIAYFDKRDLMDVISNNGRVELKLVGRLKTGRYFYGTDTVRIINRRPPPRRRWHSR